MRRRLAWVFGGGLWLLLVLYVSFYVSFPSDVLVDRARYELSKATDGGMDVEVGSIAPSGLSGAKARDVKLFVVDKGERTQILQLRSARASVGLFSLLGNPKARANLDLGDGGVKVGFTANKLEKGGYGLGDLEVSAASFPINAIPPISGTKISGTGELDLDMALSASEGFAKADGNVRLSAKDISIEEGTGMAAMVPLPLTIEEIDLRIEVSKGKADVMRGRIASSLVTADLSGNIDLNDSLLRSRLRLEAVLTLGEAAQAFASLLKSAKWDDDTYHYALSGTLGSPRVSPKAERKRTTTRPERPTRPDRDPAAEVVPVPKASKETLDAAREARERARERRAAAAAGGPPPGPEVDGRAVDTEEEEEGEFIEEEEGRPLEDTEVIEDDEPSEEEFVE